MFLFVYIFPLSFSQMKDERRRFHQCFIDTTNLEKKNQITRDNKSICQNSLSHFVLLFFFSPLLILTCLFFWLPHGFSLVVPLGYPLGLLPWVVSLGYFLGLFPWVVPLGCSFGLFLWVIPLVYSLGLFP